MDKTKDPIVCGVDRSGSAEAAGVAAELARSLDRPLILVHVVDDLSRSPYGDPRERELQRQRSVSSSHRLLQEAAARLDAVLTVRLGDPADVLHAVCREEGAELLVVGSRGPSGPAGALRGRLSVRVASKGMCPVVIVPPGAGERFTTARATSGGAIICGVDGAPESARAVSVAEWLGGRLGLETLPVFVTPPRSRKDAARSPAQILTGDPARELRKRATRKDARMIVVGSRGHGVLRRALLGSVSAALATAAPVPVLVVPPEARLPAALGDPVQPDASETTAFANRGGTDEEIIARGIPLF